MKSTCVCLFLFIFSVVGEAQSPAEVRAREISALISTGDRAAVRKYVDANFSDQMRGLPMDRHLSFFSSEHDQSRGLEVNRVQDSGPNEVTLLVKNRLTGDWQGLLVVVEPTPPHKIAGIGRRPPKPPATEIRKFSDKEIAREIDAFAQKLAAADVFSGTILL